MKNNLDNPLTTKLFDAILSLETVEECYAFFEDICTITEVQSLSLRWEVAQLLNEGKTYTEIGQLTNVSTATISRVNRFLNYGANGYRMALDRMKEKKANEGESL